MKPCKNCIHHTACVTANPDMVKKTFECEHFEDNDLINRQKAEIKKLDGQVTHLIGYVKTLKTEKDNLIRTYAECQAEAVKEFAEKLKEQYEIWDDDEYYFNYVTTDQIDNLLKETVGD